MLCDDRGSILIDPVTPRPAPAPESVFVKALRYLDWMDAERGRTALAKYNAELSGDKETDR